MIQTSFVPISKYSPYRAEDVFENQILAFFDRNPDEELTSADTAVKFSRGINKAREKLKALTDKGLLVRYGVPFPGGTIEYVYGRKQ